MLQFVVAAGVAYFLLREGMKKEAPTPEPVPEPEPTPTPPPTRDYEEVASWSGEGSLGESVVWLYERYLVYADGEREKNGSSHIVIGNANHTSFLRSSVSGGTINIPKELSGGDADMKNVRVFASIEDAMSYLEEQAKPADPNDPVQPQPQPDDEDDNSTPSFPNRPPGFGGGLGDMTPSFGGM